MVGILQNEQLSEVPINPVKPTGERKGLKYRPTPAISGVFRGKSTSKKYKAFNELGGCRVMPMIRRCCRQAKLDPDSTTNFAGSDGKTMTDEQIGTFIGEIRKRDGKQPGTTNMNPVERSMSWYADPRSELFTNKRKTEIPRKDDREHLAKIQDFVEHHEKHSFQDRTIVPTNAKMRGSRIRITDDEKEQWAKAIHQHTGVRMFPFTEIPTLPNAAEALEQLENDLDLTQEVTLEELIFRLILAFQLLFQPDTGENGCFCNAVLTHPAEISNDIVARRFPEVKRPKISQAEWGGKAHYSEKRPQCQMTFHLTTGDCFLMPRATGTAVVCPSDDCREREHKDKEIDFCVQTETQATTKVNWQTSGRMARESGKHHPWRTIILSAGEIQTDHRKKHINRATDKAAKQVEPFTSPLYSTYLLNCGNRDEVALSDPIRRTNERAPFDERSTGNRRIWVAFWQMMKREQIFLFNHRGTRFPDLDKGEPSRIFPFQFVAGINEDQRRREYDSADIYQLQVGQYAIEQEQRAKLQAHYAKGSTALEDKVVGLEGSSDEVENQKKRKLVPNDSEKIQPRDGFPALGKVKVEKLSHTKPWSTTRETRNKSKKPKFDENSYISLSDDDTIKGPPYEKLTSADGTTTQNGTTSQGETTQDEETSTLPSTPNFNHLVDVKSQTKSTSRTKTKSRIKRTLHRPKPELKPLTSDLDSHEEEVMNGGGKRVTKKCTSESVMDSRMTTEAMIDTSPSEKGQPDNDGPVTSPNQAEPITLTTTETLGNSRSNAGNGNSTKTDTSVPKALAHRELSPDQSSFADKSLKKDWTPRGVCEFEGMGPNTATDTSDDEEPAAKNSLDDKELERCLNDVVGKNQMGRRDAFKSRLLANKPIINLENRQDISDFCKQLAATPEFWYFHIGDERLSQKEANHLAVYARYAGGEPCLLSGTLLELGSRDTEWRSTQTNEVGFFLDGLMMQYAREGKDLRGRPNDRQGRYLANGMIGLTRDGAHPLINCSGTSPTFGQEQQLQTYKRHLATPDKVLKRIGRDPTVTVLVLITDETEARMKEKCELPIEMRRSDAKKAGNSGYGHLKVRFGAKTDWVEHIANLTEQKRDYHGEKPKGATVNECGAFMVIISPYGLQKAFSFDHMYQINQYWLSTLINQTTNVYQEALMMRIPLDYASTNSYGRTMPQALAEILLPDQVSAIGFHLRRNGARAGLTAADNFSRIRMYVLTEVTRHLAEEASQPATREKLLQIEKWAKKVIEETMPANGHNSFIAAAAPNNKIPK